MPLTDLIIPAIAFLLGIVAAYLFFRQQISAIEGRARNDLERWKLECTNDIRKDSINRSRSTLKGRISEQMAPLLARFEYHKINIDALKPVRSKRHVTRNSSGSLPLW